MSWLFSQALVEEYLADISLDGEQSVQSNGSNTQQAYCALDKMTDFCQISQFGMMYKPLTESLGEELLMSYLAGFHAKTSQPLAKGGELLEAEAPCGSTWQGSLARYDQAMSLWKIHQSSLLEDSAQYLETFPKWGSMRSGELLAQTMPGCLTEESVYGCWLPTPTVSMKNGCSSKRYRGSEEYRGSMPMEWIRVSKDCAQDFHPDYAELVMDFPDKWTDLNPLATHKYQEWLDSHGEFLAKD
jgi:hypothetical protein